MLRVALFATIFASLALLAAAGEGSAPAYCGSSASIAINETTGTWGCSGSAARIAVDWNFSPSFGRTLRWTINGYTDMTLSFYVNDVIVYGPWYQTSNYYYFPKGQSVRVRYYSGTSTQSSYGLSITSSPEPDNINALVSGQTTSITTGQPGGFIYFLLPSLAFGKLLYIDVEVFSYQGLREPSVYIGRQKVPTLEQYDYTNQTVSTSGGRETCLVYITDPPAAPYMVGVFLYGQAASMSVTASWTFSMLHLQSGVKVSKSTNSVDYYQVIIPYNTPKLTFQISRQVPGGYATAYIAQGSIPSATNYGWIAETAKQSYIAITITNPNPAGSKAANPGNYIFAIQSDGASCGYIIQVDW